MSRYPILCRHCGAPIDAVAPRVEGVPWTHKLGEGEYRIACPEPLRTNAEPET